MNFEFDYHRGIYLRKPLSFMSVRIRDNLLKCKQNNNCILLYDNFKLVIFVLFCFGSAIFSLFSSSSYFEKMSWHGPFLMPLKWMMMQLKWIMMDDAVRLSCKN